MYRKIATHPLFISKCEIEKGGRRRPVVRLKELAGISGWLWIKILKIAPLHVNLLILKIWKGALHIEATSDRLGGRLCHWYM